MGLFSYLFGRDIDEKALNATPAVLDSIRTGQFQQYISLGSAPNARRNDRIDGIYVAVQNASYGQIYRYQPAVRSVINYVAGQISQLSVKCYERVDDDDRRQAGDHPAAEVLRRPNPFTPGKSFIKGLIKDFLIYDNCYAVKLRSGGPLQLVRVSPSRIGILGQSHFQADGYRIWRGNGEFFDVPVSDMVHWKGEDSEDPRMGWSNLETLREELALDAANRGAAAELARNGLGMPGYIKRSMDAPEWSSEARKRFEEDWANRAKAGTRRTPVLEEGMEFVSGGVSPEDAELLKAREFAQEYVASLYGLENIPPNTDESRKAFYNDILPDYCGQLADALNLQIIYDEFGESSYYYEFNLDDKQAGDERIKTMTSAAGGPIFTRDEARAKFNLPALPDGAGEEIITPLNVTVGGKPTPGTMPIQDPNKPPQDGSARTGEADRPDEAGTRALPPKPRPFLPSGKAQLLPRRRAKERRRDEAAADVTAAISGFLSHMERSLKSKGMDTKAVEDDRWISRLSAALEEANQRTVKLEGEVTAARLASSFDMALVKNYVKTVSDAKAKEIVHAVRDALRQEGADPTEVFKNGREVAAVNAGMTIATSLTTFSTAEAARQAGDEQFRTKTWIVTSGNSDHPEMDGETVPLGESFSNGTDGPPADHPGCQCLMEIDGGGHPPSKSLDNGYTSAPNGYTQPLNITVNIPEGAFKSEVNVAPSPAPNVTVEPGVTNVTTPEVKVGDTNLVIEKGAMSAPSVTVEPAQTTFEEGAFSVDVKSSEQAPNVNVTMEAPKSSKKIVRDDQGLIKEIVEANRKQVVIRDPETKRITAIEEE